MTMNQPPFALTSVQMPALGASPTFLSADILIDEERNEGYDPKHFYPVNPGSIYASRYEIKIKLG